MSNLSRLRSAMQEKGVSAMLLSDIDSVRWASGFTGSSGWAILTASEGLFVTDSRYTLQAGEEVKDLRVATFGNPVTSTQFLKEQLSALGISKLGFESQSVTYAVFDEWRNVWQGVELQPVKSLVGPLRMVKNEEEIAAIRRACKMADACFEHVCRMIQPGVSEYDLALDIEFYFRRQGAKLAFEPIVVSGERSARPHGKPSEKKLERGDFVTMDFGAQVDGLCSDLTRTVVVGKATDRHREVYDQVLRAEEASIQMMREGLAAKDVDAHARQILDEKGLAKYFGHGLGHGLGRVVHDSGRLSPSSEDTLEAGQVWTVEPGVYIEGFGGVRIEDDVLVTENGVEVLTHAPKQLMELAATGA